MPESAEVQILVDQLNHQFKGQSLRNVEIVGGKFIKKPIDLSCVNFPLHNAQFYSKGKFIFWTFNQESIFGISLGMTGSFGGEKTKHSAIKFEFFDDCINIESNVFFNDIRRFGNFKVLSQGELNQKLDSLGFDILKDKIPTNIVEQVRRFDKKIFAEVLMNQEIFAGCGNYLRSECLYLAKIYPLKLVKDLSDDDICGAVHALKALVRSSYKVGGATIQTFQDLNGNSGKFFDQFNVYRQKQDPFGNPVSRMQTKNGRSIYYVKAVQEN